MAYKIALLILFSALIIKYFKNINNQFNFFDTPDYLRKLHKKKIPFSGGFFIFLVFNLYVLLFFNNEKFILDLEKKEKIVFLVTAILIFFIGLLDDFKKISIARRIFLFLFLISFFIFMYDESLFVNSIRLSFFYFEINLLLFKYLLIIFSFFAFYNALNMYDGINGQASIYLIFILSVFYFFYDQSLIFIFLILLLLIFFYFNIQNKVFLGNSGIIFFSFIISFIIIKFYNEKKILLADEIVLLMFMPGIDLIRVFLERILKKKNPFVADQNHCHHILLKKYGLKFTLFITTSLSIIPFIIYKSGFGYSIPFLFSFFAYILVLQFSKIFKK
jgi:UDP-GlcNAc:undecaprenyl-phosphate GlcNAc-1-phosphate transferase